MNSRAAVAESRAAVSASEVVFRRNPRTEEFEYVSASVEPLTGFTAEEMCRLGLPEILSRVHPQDCPRMAGAIEAISAGGRVTIEYRFQHRDGIYRWIAEDTEFLCTRDGVPLYRFGFLRDITEEKGIAECAGASTELFVSEAEHAQGWSRGRMIGALATTAGILAAAAGLVYRTSVGEDQINSASSEITRKLGAENAALRTATEDLRVKIEVLVEERGRLTEEIAAKDRLVAGLTEQRNTARQARAAEPKQTELSAAPEPHRIPIPEQPATTQVAPAIDFRQSAAADVVVRPAQQPRAPLVQPVAPDPPSVR